ncbi:uncharacterized protein LOC130641317 [Hydractinia symbiolongicarpus]|uniref:uncharacterized protein LOC130641317 n=1 Tax=Hydractinia symbiolongicarpus TaxID=13093 RepID=UPI00254D70B4|nr:uncharacterized protein LOC130641317 [Hydractinia symbiolongicarpus]
MNYKILCVWLVMIAANAQANVISTTVAPANCTNISPYCIVPDQHRVTYCHDPDRIDWMIVNCAQFCRFCTCHDEYPRCSRYPQTHCEKYKEWMGINCRQFCKICT